jgi:hypothetical protein
VRKKLAVGFLAALLFLGVWAFYLEPSSLEVHELELVLPRWPEDSSALTVALLSDLHVGSPYYDVEKLEAVVERVNGRGPDLVLLAGDYVIGGVLGGEFTTPEDVAAGLEGLDAPLGVYAVLGNHDWWFDGSRIRRAFEREGVRVLDNESLHIQREGFDFWLIGLGDLWESRPDVDLLLEGIPAGAPAIAFTHNPDVFPEIPPRVSLTLAGHTHGGQVRFPLLGTPVVPSRYGERFVRGHIVEDGRHLYVTSGLGTSILPVRFRVPPEVVILRIVGADLGS